MIMMIIPNIWENKKWQPNHQPDENSERLAVNKMIQRVQMFQSSIDFLQKKHPYKVAVCSKVLSFHKCRT